MHNPFFKKTTALALVLVASSGCDVTGVDNFTPEVAVSGVLIADEILPLIHLALTGPIGEAYDPVERSINDAVVRLQWLRNNGTVVDLPYELSNGGMGIYKAANPEDSVRVQGGGTYRFEAIVPGFPETVTAETIVPTAFSIASPLPDTVFYQVGNSPHTSVFPSSYPGRQNVYVFNVRALEPDVYPLTPFAFDLVNDRDVDPVDLRASNSPLLNEGNFEVNPDGTIRFSIIWLAFNYFGPQRVLLTAVDDALIDFIESQTIQFLPTTLSPGEIPNVVSNVQNGTGVFGSVAQATTETFLAPAP